MPSRLQQWTLYSLICSFHQWFYIQNKTVTLLRISVLMVDFGISSAKLHLYLYSCINKVWTQEKYMFTAFFRVKVSPVVQSSIPVQWIDTPFLNASREMCWKYWWLEYSQPKRPLWRHLSPTWKSQFYSFLLHCSVYCYVYCTVIIVLLYCSVILFCYCPVTLFCYNCSLLFCYMEKLFLLLILLHKFSLPQINMDIVQLHTLLPTPALSSYIGVHPIYPLHYIILLPLPTLGILLPSYPVLIHYPTPSHLSGYHPTQSYVSPTLLISTAVYNMSGKSSDYVNWNSSHTFSAPRG